jgi:hypothetical protein
MIRVFIILASALLLAACGGSKLTESFTFLQTPEKPVKRDVFPAAFKQEIINVIPSIVSERRGIREAYYSDPSLDPKINTYFSCVRFNARDRAGEYQGAKEYAAYYYDGHLNQFVIAPPDQCGTAPYKPFPELERLCVGTKCS